MKALFDLLKKLGKNERYRLIHFSVSTTVFFVAYAMLYWVNNEMEASVDQEWAALGCLVVAAMSFIWAITLQVVFIVSKMINK